jgi:hypothetical protein
MFWLPLIRIFSTQNLVDFNIAILLLKARRTTYSVLKPLVLKALTELETIKAGDIVIID